MAVIVGKNEGMSRFEAVGLLYDFYGPLLTQKQAAAIEMYFIENLSLAEIGQEIGATKQAASILIKRTESKLNFFEQKLGLLQKFEKTKAALAELTQELEQAAGRQPNEETRQALLQIRARAVGLLDDL